MTDGQVVADKDIAPRAGGLALFFACAFGITWVLQVPGVLAQRGMLAGPVEAYLPMAMMGIFGPTIAAVIAARHELGRAGVRALFRPLCRWKVGVVWYAIALGSPTIIFVVGHGVYRLFSADEGGRWLYPPGDAQRIVAMVIISFAEEVGWRGYALPRLQHSYGAVRASVVLGMLWSLWHTPMLLGAGIPVDLFPVMMIYFVAGTLVFTWIYNHTRGSLLLAVLAHMGAHLCNTHQALPADATPFLIQTAGYVAVAFFLLLADRNVWRYPRAR